MAYIKVKFRPPSSANSFGSVYYQVVHERHVRRINTTYKVLSSEWDKDLSFPSPIKNSPRAAAVLSIQESIARDTRRLAKIIQYYEKSGYTFGVDDIVCDFERYSRECTLFSFMEMLIASFRQNHKIRISETYSAALNSFKRFRAYEDIALDAVRSDIIEAYQAYLQACGLVPNTVSFYMRILRAAYNRAVERELTEQRNPFRHVYTGVDKTIKRALPLKTIKKLKTLDISLVPQVEYARDMFLLSFYLRGMSFVDMAYLKKEDLRHGYITYRRRKTGQSLIIAWTEEMQLILDKYPRNPTQYLLPIINKTEINERYCYRNTGYNINRNLKKLAEIAGLDVPLTMYYARHSWASAAKSKGVPISVISEGMGHDSEATTRIYLSSLDTSLVDKANQLILSSL